MATLLSAYSSFTTSVLGYKSHNTVIFISVHKQQKK